MGLFYQNVTISYAGSAMEEAITLTRPDNTGATGKWDIKELRLSAVGASAGSYVQLIRKSSASTANERDDSHADSKGVLMGEQFISNGDAVFDFDSSSVIGERNLSDTPLRLYLSLGGSSTTVYATIKYVYSG